MIEHRLSKSDEYSKTINLNDVPICAIVEGSESNVLLQRVIQLVKTYAGDILEICSRTGEFKANNVSVYNASFWALWPNGDYRNTFKFYDNTDDNILNVTYNGIVQRFA